MAPMTSDDDLEALLRDLTAERDPAPTHVTDAARAAWELRDLDTQLATLVADSWRDEPAVATRDHAGTLRMLTFTSDGASIEVAVSVPVVDVELPVDGLAPGPARLSVFGTDGGRVVTTWVSL